MSRYHHRRHTRRTTRHLNLSGRRLYRLPQQGQLAGVCAGLAEHFQISTWMMRLIAVTGLLFIPSIIIPLYILAIFILPTKNELKRDERSILGELDDNDIERQRKKRRFDAALDDDAEDFRSLDKKRSVVQRYKQSFDTLENRLQSMERHVTSKQYELSREIDRL